MAFSPKTWQRVEELVEAASRLPPAERFDFLERSCGDDETLRKTVAKVLASYDAVDDFLEAPPVGMVSALSTPSPEPSPPPTTGGRPRRVLPKGERVEHHIGPYRTLRYVGHGGMSDVYLAVRKDDAFRRHVALKVVHGEDDVEQLIRRFKSERQILASLDHPGIAKLLDGGTAEDGRPYLVLEYIEGIPIDQYCDQQRLSTSQRLELLVKVCAAVQYAHQNLVVHRDIKPSNILVTQRGEPKLLDFGIAKMLNPNLLPHTVEHTRTDVRPMTPQYASPEQLLGQPVTTVSDVYSLGVLLYKLLTGRLPFAISRFRPSELDRVLAGTEPTPPSEAVGELLGDWDSGSLRSPELIASARGTQPAVLKRQLVGDLDTMAMMALRREPSRRYASADQLAEDLSLHLRGLPVRARRDTFAYRMGKFLRRNRISVGLTAGVCGLLVLFAVTVFMQSLQIARERDRATLERDKAQQVADFMVDLFHVADPSELRGNTVTVREVLDRGALNVGLELQDQPEIQAALMHTIGRVYARLGLYDPAAELLRNALEIRQRRLEASTDVAASAYELARLCMARGEYGEAVEQARFAVQQQTEALGWRHRETQASVLLLGHLYRNLGRFEESVEQFDGMLDAGAVVHPELEKERLQGLAMTSHFQGRYALALQLYQRLDALPSKNPEATAIVHHGMGVLFRDLREWDRAREYLTRSYRIRTEVLGPSHHLTVSSYLSLGRVAWLQGNLDEARQIFEQSIGQTQDFYRQGSEDTLTLARLAAAYTDLAMVLRLQGELDQQPRAQALVEEAVLLMEPITRQSDMVWFLDAHARALIFLGRVEAARPMAEELLRRGWDHFDFEDLCFEHGIFPPVDT